MPIENAVGRRLGRTIWSDDKKPLLTAGTVLTSGYIGALRRRGYKNVYVINEFAPDIQVDDAINENTRVRATFLVREAILSVSDGKKFDMDKVVSVVDQILEDLDSNPRLLVSLSTLRCHNDATFVHSVNVCVLSLLIGSSLYYPRRDLIKLGIGAILHDIGKAKIPSSLLSKPAPYTDDELLLISEHPKDGYIILRRLEECSVLSAHVAFQHHERLDGSGYPRKLRGTQIHRFARIAAVADVYDLISSGRNYGDQISPNRAADILLLLSETLFDGVAVRKLLEKVAIYPNGSVVRINTGQLAVVARQNQDMNERPVLRLLTDERCNALPPTELDLRLFRDIEIVSVLEDLPEKLRHSVPPVKTRPENGRRIRAVNRRRERNVYAE